MRKRGILAFGLMTALIAILWLSIFYIHHMDVKRVAETLIVQTKGNKEANPYPAPSMEDVPDGDEGELIKLGSKIHNETSTVLYENVGGTLSCVSCHANGGVNSSMDLVGVSKTYPQYNSRAGKVISLEERINGCFLRSLNGKPLPEDSKEMKAMVAYYNYISQNVPDGTTERPWANLNKAKGDITNINVNKGEELYNRSCISCHGQDGNGQGNGLALWGENSFNVGAGMNRMRTLAGFIESNMPQNNPGSLTKQEALEIAAYIHSMERPDFPEKIHDWPKGDAPDDAAYKTLAGKKDESK